MSRFSRGCLLFSIAILALLGAGCKRGADSNDGKTVIKFWHFWSEPAQKKALLDRIKSFEDENPTLHVELSELSWNDGKTKLLAAFNSNTAPDVLELGSDWVAQFSSAGVLADQSKDANFAARFSADVLAPGVWNGATYALPWVIDTRVLFVNNELKSRAGLDTNAVDSLWDQVLTSAETIKHKVPDTYGFGINGPDQHRLYKKILPFFWSNHGEILDATGKPVLNTPQNVVALDLYLQLARTGIIETQKQLDQMFLQGKVGYLISGSWLVDRIKSENQKLAYKVAVMPAFAGGTHASFAGGEYLAISNESKQKEGAKKLITFLTSGEQALAFCKALPGGMTPADKGTATDPFLQTPVRKVFATQLVTARMTPVNPKWLDMEAVIEDEISQAVLGNKSSQQALDAAQVKITQLLNNQDITGADSSEH